LHGRATSRLIGWCWPCWRSCCRGIAGRSSSIPAYTRDAASVASGVGGASLDVSGHRAGPAGDGPRGRRPGGADGAGEPAMGLPEDCGGVPQAGCAGVGAVGFFAATGWGRRRGAAGRVERRSCAPRPPACSPVISDRGDDGPNQAVRAVHSRTRAAPGASGRAHRASHWCLDDAGGPQSDDGPRQPCPPVPVPHPRSRLKVHRRVRCGVRRGGH
jgi:hypothetical protein